MQKHVLAIKPIHLKQANDYDHLEMIPDVIKDVPSIIEHPVVVMKSQTREDSIVMFGDVPSAKRPVMVAINLAPLVTGGLEADFNLISSAYGRTESNAKTLIESSEILYLGEKNRAETLLMSLRVQFPSGQQAFDSTFGSISYEGNSVKIFGKKIFETFSESESGLKPSLADTDAEYLELAKNPEKNKARLEEMVEKAVGYRSRSA